jgi:hypothetical protein
MDCSPTRSAFNFAWRSTLLGIELQFASIGQTSPPSKTDRPARSVIRPEQLHPRESETGPFVHSIRRRRNVIAIGVAIVAARITVAISAVGITIVGIIPTVVGVSAGIFRATGGAVAIMIAVMVVLCLLIDILALVLVLIAAMALRPALGPFGTALVGRVLQVGVVRLGEGVFRRGALLG